MPQNSTANQNPQRVFPPVTSLDQSDDRVPFSVEKTPANQLPFSMLTSLTGSPSYISCVAASGGLGRVAEHRLGIPLPYHYEIE